MIHSILSFIRERFHLLKTEKFCGIGFGWWGHQPIRKPISGQDTHIKDSISFSSNSRDKNVFYKSSKTVTHAGDHKKNEV
jgi:hypothetical protein